MLPCPGVALPESRVSQVRQRVGDARAIAERPSDRQALLVQTTSERILALAASHVSQPGQHGGDTGLMSPAVRHARHPAAAARRRGPGRSGKGPLSRPAAGRTPGIGPAQPSLRPAAAVDPARTGAPSPAGDSGPRRRRRPASLPVPAICPPTASAGPAPHRAGRAAPNDPRWHRAVAGCWALAVCRPSRSLLPLPASSPQQKWRGAAGGVAPAPRVDRSSSRSWPGVSAGEGRLCGCRRSAGGRRCPSRRRSAPPRAPDARSRQLDRQGDPLQPPADRHAARRAVLREGEGGCGGHGAFDKETHGLELHQGGGRGAGTYQCFTGCGTNRPESFRAISPVSPTACGTSARSKSRARSTNQTPSTNLHRSEIAAGGQCPHQSVRRTVPQQL
jgi:hypothetical protein